MKVVQEEIFGPVSSCCRSTTRTRASRSMNGTDFGLYDYVFSADTEQGVPREQAIARRQHRHQHDAAQPQHAVRRHEVQRRRSRRRCVRAARVHRSAVGRLARLMARDRRRSPSFPTACSRTACSCRCRRCRCASRCRGSRRRRVDDMVRVAQAADAAGFLYVAVCHHVAIPPRARGDDVDAVVRPDRDARRTSRRTRRARG